MKRYVAKMGQVSGEYTRFVPVYHVTVDNPLNQFSVLQPPKGCSGKTPSKPSETASASNHSCVVVGSGGFYNSNVCLGNTVSDGTVAHNQTSTNAGFGVREDGTLVIGYIPQSEFEKTVNPFRNFVTGVGWLVHEGKNYVTASSLHEDTGALNSGDKASFFTAVAARSAIGYDKDGKVHLYHFDGNAKGTNQGISLFEMAQFLQGAGMIEAINLIGGGSASLTYDSTVISVPSDMFGSAPLFTSQERAIMTTICLKN